MTPTESDIGVLKAEMARQNKLRWKVAVESGVHPVRFSAMLSGRLPMPERVYEHVRSALRIKRGPDGS